MFAVLQTEHRHFTVERRRRAHDHNVAVLLQNGTPVIIVGARVNAAFVDDLLRGGCVARRDGCDFCAPVKALERTDVRRADGTGSQNNNPVHGFSPFLLIKTRRPLRRNGA